MAKAPSQRPPGGSRRAATRLAGLLALVLPLASPGLDERASGAHAPEGSSGCLACHGGIEDMHPEAEVSCVDCHGGDASARKKLAAHARRPRARTTDERVADPGKDLAWRRFRNPMDLRVVDRTCATCHEHVIEHLLASLHGTTAGHLSDGYYEMGLFDGRGSRYSVFPVPDAPKIGGEVDRLIQVPAFRDNLPELELSTHYTDLARKECMQCHLWSGGRAVRGRVGFDGDYRGEGCAACHVTYALDGLTGSADQTVPRNEPGHPLGHTMTRAPPTSTCSACHYGDASIGLHFRGLSQLPPGAPGGPDIPGTTESPLNRAFYLNDPAMVPPDVHHEKGMHCIDCHTLADVMGDGRLHGRMERAVEITCQSCHGTFTRRPSLRTERGAPLENLRREGDRVILTSKVDGREHVVPQVVDVLDPGRPEYDAEAARAMTKAHANVECYTCHAGWNVNFLGFHFSRNASLTQLDLLAGERTPGRVTTQEKVFATWKSFYAGLNERGAVAPYLTGFSTMGSVWDAEGRLILDQVMPVTAEGLSGMTMVHHQLHSTRPTARSCVECHRSSATWGIGSPNFRLARQLAFVGDRRGLEIVGLDRTNLAASPPLAKLVLPDIVAIEAHCDDLQGHAHHVYVAEGGRGVHVVDVTDPTRPRRAAFVASVNPRGMELAGDHLYLADGIGGLRIYDVSEPEEIRLVGDVAMFDAHDVHVQWPHAYVADGPGGLAIVDVRAPIAPSFVTAIDVNGTSRVPNEAITVATLFQYGRPVAVEGEPLDRRTKARHLAAVLDRRAGLTLVDVTEAERPLLLLPRAEDEDRTRGERRRGPTMLAAGLTYRGLVLLSQVDLAEPQGGEPTRERDYAYVLAESRLENGQRRSTTVLYDVSNPTSVRFPRHAVEAGYSTEMLVPAAVYNPPFLRRMLFSPGELGVFVSDVSISREPKQGGTLPGLIEAYAIAVEEFPLDRMIDEKGRRLKDISHAESRWLYRAEIERILDVSAEELGSIHPDEPEHEPPGITARLHLANLDLDGSGMLEGDEYGPAGGAAIDLDGDGRICLAELAERVGILLDPSRSTNGEGMEAAAVEVRSDPDGPLARLLDGTDPFGFDKDRNGRLSRSEATRALFAALDLDGDGRLVPDELSRRPGTTRRIRHGDGESRRIFREHDSNGDGAVSQRELSIDDREWRELDSDGDGSCQLPADPALARSRRPAPMAESEWPYRRDIALALPPILSAETFYAFFDGDGDRRITQREMRRRPELFAVLDADQDGLLSEREVGRAIDVIGRRGVEATADGFLPRWDLDGSGAVEDDEIPGAAPLRFRGIVERR